jgi:hypothetical protein
MSCICVHISVLCCMYVHMCAYLYVSMRLALLAAKNTCRYAHTCTYSSSYMHIHFKYIQKYITHKSVHMLYVFACICLYMYVSCVYPVQYQYVSEKLCFCISCTFLHKFQLHVCACIILYLLEIRLKRRGITGMDRSYSNSSTKQSRHCFNRPQQDSHWHLAILCPTCSCSTAGCQTPAAQGLRLAVAHASKKVLRLHDTPSCISFCN